MEDLLLKIRSNYISEVKQKKKIVDFTEKVIKFNDECTVTTRTIKEQIVNVTKRKRKSSGDLGDDEEDNALTLLGLE